MTESQKKQYDRQNAFCTENYDRITLAVPKGKREIYRKCAQSRGMSLTAFAMMYLDRALMETADSDENEDGK